MCRSAWCPRAPAWHERRPFLFPPHRQKFDAILMLPIGSTRLPVELSLRRFEYSWKLNIVRSKVENLDSKFRKAIKMQPNGISYITLLKLLQ